MEDLQQNNDQYLIPKNVNTRFTFFPGFGWKELFFCIVGIIISVIIFFILSLFIRNIIIKAIISLFPVLFTFLVTREDPRTGVSLLSLLKALRNFLGQQKLYLYYYGKGRE